MELLVYSIFLAVGLLFTLTSAVFGHCFGHADADVQVGGDGHSDFGIDHGGMPGVSIFSPLVIAIFVTAFGALGILFTAMETTAKAWLSAPLAGAGAVAVAGAIYVLLNKLFKATQSSSESHVSEVAGLTATVITPIPAGGVGEIAYVHGGTRYNAPARSTGETVIPAGASVLIIRLSGTQFYVERMD